MNHLVVRLAVNMLSWIETLQDITEAMVVVQELLKEDEPTSAALSYRWKCVFARLEQDSIFYQLVRLCHQDEIRANSGNPDGGGRNDEQLDDMEIVFLRMISLPLGTPFFVLNADRRRAANPTTNHALERLAPDDPRVTRVTPHVFAEWTHGGVRNRLEGRRPKNNTNRRKTNAATAQLPYKIQKNCKYGNRGAAIMVGDFVLCHLEDK